MNPSLKRKHLRFNLALKLWMVLFAATSILVASLLLWFRFSVNHGFQNFIERLNRAHVEALIPELESLYTAEGSWQFLLNDPQLWRQLVREAWLQSTDRFDRGDDAEPPPGADMPPPIEPDRSNDRRRDNKHSKTNTRVALADRQHNFMLGSYHILDDNPKWLPLQHNGEVVGYVGYAAPKRFKSPEEVKFLKRQTENLVIIGIMGLLISAVFAFPLAAYLVRPIRKLESSTQALTRGNYQTRIDQISNDELGSLALHFNELAATLEANENSRRKWVTDISHELRTPVTFIKGQIEALIDGIRPTTAENLQALEQQINQLSKLIDELYALSQSELGGMNYKKHWLQVKDLIDLTTDQASAAMRDKGLEFTVINRVASDYLLFIDESRFCQLMNNLLANSLRHTAAPGQVTLTAVGNDIGLTITLLDSNPGVNDDELPKLFDRLYRTDQSRNSATGGSGIGLTLCKNIVEAHGGDITLHHSELGGLQVTVTIPILQNLD
ncbi:ATP-binding protein [Halioxenophilus aromaticivorans]|uniref:histidine kinase n=1 Tax=Halioxenophilus aromaticivorans TaxID=1306992 RepID=A0AAV3U9G7_9ALTE